MTMGWGVALDQVSTSVLKRRLDSDHAEAVEVANAGMGTFNPCGESWVLSHQFESVDPDLIVLQYFV